MRVSGRLLGARLARKREEMLNGPDVRPHLPALRRYALALARDPD